MYHGLIYLFIRIYIYIVAYNDYETLRYNILELDNTLYPYDDTK